MEQADFEYSQAKEADKSQIDVTILADNATSQGQWREDVELAGLKIVHIGALSELGGAIEYPIGEIILVECPQVDAKVLYALAQLDPCIARAGSEIVVVTTAPALESVCACLIKSRHQVLIDPTRTERAVSLGWAISRSGRTHLREQDGFERLALLRLTEEVAEIAKRLDRMGQPGLSADGGVFRFESPARDFRGEPGDGTSGLVRGVRPSLPDPRLVRRVIQHRQMRARFFDSTLFADPAWDMLLDLTAARAEHARVSVSSLCIASGVPPTTALRWIGQMIEAGLFVRTEDGVDKRRAFIALSDQAAEAMARFFSELGKSASKLV